MTKSYLMNSLIEKHTFMGLNDLLNETKQDPNSFLGDESVENKVLRQVLKLVEDKISEVKNQAVKWSEFVVEALIQFLVGKDEELRDISGLALKMITSELPTDGKITGKACSELAPKLLNQVLNPDTPPDTLIETLSTLSILITRFPAHFSYSQIKPQPLTAIAPLLTHSRPAVRKRAISTLSQFFPIAPPDLCAQLLQTNVFPYLEADANLEPQRTTVNLLASSFDRIIPGVLKALCEGCLQALETLLLRSSAEATPFLSSIIQTGIQYIKYDLDEEMAEADEDDEDEDLDDLDASYKIRRAATKLLVAVIVTRPELLVPLYKEVSTDREATVRLEVWATYITLLNQTSMYGGLPHRKRESEDSMDVEETPYMLLKSQIPALSKALLPQLKSPTTTTSTLHPTCLSFLGLFFSTHPPPVFTLSLPVLVPVLLKSLGERHPRVASETFRTFSALLNVTRPVKSGDWPERVYNHAIQRLSTTDTDAEVRSCAEDCIADLWVCVTDMVRAKDGKEWHAICRTTGNTSGAVRVVTKVVRDVEMSDDLALSILALLLELAPETSFPPFERELLADIYPIAHSPLVSGAALDALLSFFSALVTADDQITMHKSSGKGDANPMNMAKCIGVAAGMIEEYSQYIKVRGPFFDWTGLGVVRY
ncbi:ARM repeat-containing protein [Pisolithus marmoratus]|nr:ARM repeat-containing protein [Pisolithus marmoratus]